MTIETIVAPNPGPFTLDGSRTYVVNHEIIIDAGPAIASHIDAVLAAAPDAKMIFITHGHSDHTEAAAEIKQRTGGAVIAPPGTLPDVATEYLKDGALWQTGSVRIEAIATPGHTAEHFCFLTPDGDLFSGDAILGLGTTIIQGHLREYLDSLRKLRSRDPRRIYPGHGPVRHDAIAWIDYYLAHRAEREAQIVNALRVRPRRLSDLREEIYPDLDPRLSRAAESQLAAHLEHLEQFGRVRRTGEMFNIQE